MRRPTRFSALFSLLKSGSASAIALAVILSCSDSTSPTMDADGVIRVKVGTVEIVIPDSVKQAMLAQSSIMTVPSVMSASVLASPVSAVVGASSVVAGAGCGSGNAFSGYTVSKVAFTPEAIPNTAPFPLKDDGIILDKDVQFGFDFSFQGNTYKGVNIYMNGFLLFGPVPSLTAGYPDAQSIPAQLNPNNILALAWTDWSPQLVPDAIRFQTRGAAPNRRWVFQYNNVPEYYSASKIGAIVPSAGRLMTQLVLYEGSNDIVIYTNMMNVTNSKHFVTQGIENAAGTDATFETVTNAAGVVSSRVKNFYKLENDAVRFSLVSTKDEQIPSITAPSNVSKGNDPGLASAVVAVGSPVAADNCGDVNVTNARSDGVAIDAPYPVGLTTITWTATDAAGNKASATQTVEVLDVEAPVYGASAQSVLRVNATSPAGAAVTFDFSVTDNVGVVSQSCEPASGSMFSAGNHDVICSAIDAAGNKGYKSFSVFVVNAQQQMESLMIILRRQPNGTAQPLINQLKSAYRERGNECKKMDDFMHLLSVKAENISEADMAAITSAAQDIIGALGCEASASDGAEAPAPSPHLSKAPRDNTSEPVKF